MRLYLLIILLLVFCLAGCSTQASNQETTLPFREPTHSTPTTVPTAPPETPPASTESTQAEAASTQPTVQPEPEDEDFVKVTAYIPDLITDLRYATGNNFTGQQIYDFTDVWLRYGTVKKLMKVQEELHHHGLRLKIWDGFRPPSAQFKLWDVYPDPTYVSNPNNGFSSHSRGNTVDITLTDTDGKDLVMPTDFDDFSTLADRDYSDCTQQAADNAMFLEQLMILHGFKPYFGEWWHFSDAQTYPVEKAFDPAK